MSKSSVEWAERQARLTQSKSRAARQVEWLLAPEGAGMSMRALAKALDKPNMTVWRWVHGENEISSGSAMIINLVYQDQGGPPLDVAETAED